MNTDWEYEHSTNGDGSYSVGGFTDLDKKRIKEKYSEVEPDIHGYVIVSKLSGERWGSVYQSIGGAKNSYNKVERDRRFYQEDCVLFDKQEEYEIQPLVLATVYNKVIEENKRLKELVKNQLSCIDYQARA